MSSKRKSRGFTLIEVMIAFLIIVVGAVAVFSTASESTWKSASLWERTVAGWVAQNQLAEFRAKRSWSNTRSFSGQSEMANAEWEWRMTVSNTDNASVRRLDIDVYLKGQEGVKASLSAYMGKL
jgi:general secretion pathway protein I